MKKIVACIIGTRPEVIKMAPVIAALHESKVLRPIIIATGQHKELLSMTMNIFGIRPDYDLHTMVENQSPSQVIASVLTGLDELIKKHPVSAILVQGDTASAFAGGLSGFLNHIPVGHIEAGLRTYDLDQPWPEEAMRQLVDRIATWYFPPTEVSKRNLASEHIDPNKVYVTGNTVIDAVQSVIAQLEKSEVVLKRNGVHLHNKQYILVTGHRRENHGKAFIEVAEALKKIAQTHQNLDIIYPLHPNPNVKVPMTKALGKIENIHIIPPLGYLDFLSLMRDTLLIISDSGGVQEEASVFGKRVVLLRDTTERPEGIGAGTTSLVGCHRDKIIQVVEKIMSGPQEGIGDKHPYGKGNAAVKIVSVLEKHFRN